MVYACLQLVLDRNGQRAMAQQVGHYKKFIDHPCLREIACLAGSAERHQTTTGRIVGGVKCGPIHGRNLRRVSLKKTGIAAWTADIFYSYYSQEFFDFYTSKVNFVTQQHAANRKP